MALLFLKQHLFRLSPSNSTQYTSLPSTSSETSSISSETDLEKHSPSPSSQSAWRISPRLISDATIGLSDGLTVPFALTAGLSALGDTRVVIFGGLAELIAGAISMGLGGYLGAKGELESEVSTRREISSLTSSTTASSRDEVSSLIRQTLEPLNYPTGLLDSTIAHLLSDKDALSAFLLTFHHGLAEQTSQSRVYVSAVTIAMGYFVGGFVPLIPYLFINTLEVAFWTSVAVMTLALFVFGFAKTRLVGANMTKCLRGGIEMVVLGGLAAGAAMMLVRTLGSVAGEGAVVTVRRR